MSTRVYLAAGPEGVERLARTGELVAPAFAVTAAMRASDPEVDEEDLEYEASLAAEELLRAAGRHVVVVAADSDRAPEAVGAEVTVSRGAVVAVHVAEHDAPADEALLWYDATELDEVLAYLGG